MVRRATETEEDGSPGTRETGSRKHHRDMKGRALAGSPAWGRSPGKQVSSPTALDHMTTALNTRVDFQVPTLLCSRLTVTESAFLPAPPAPPQGGCDGVWLGRACDTGIASTRDATGSSAQDGGRMGRWRQSWGERQAVQDISAVTYEWGSAAVGPG